MEFANFSRRAGARVSRRRWRASFGFAIRDCAYDLYTQRRIIVARLSA
jgi:hypothetical protein